MKVDALDLLGDDVNLVAHATGKIPDGGLQSPPLLEHLIDSINLSGNFAFARSLLPLVPPPPNRSQCDHLERLIRTYPTQNRLPKVPKSIQGCAYCVFSIPDRVPDLNAALKKKLQITLGEEQFSFGLHFVHLLDISRGPNPLGAKQFLFPTLKLLRA